ncbi:hypothetical protein CH362_18955 [Leptospira saintgironsiae]|uniref:Uncharacterized protein n=1 Tax=Leptospira saintgironsiae TaxID=2023183 RepID=A0A2M9Y7F4_9LEPT|nr:hypothetical protein CH362_18955 [Leptospira saintgironsiae]
MHKQTRAIANVGTPWSLCEIATDNIMNPKNSFVEILQNLYQTESYKKLVVLRHFQSSLQSFRDDYMELAQVVGFTKDPIFLRQIMPLDQRPKMERYFVNVTRSFLHFAHSGQSLADHCRLLHRRYYDQEGIFSDYQKKIDDTFQDPISHFMKRLRHFCAHIEVPNLKLHTKWTKETGVVIRMIIDKDHLQDRCKDWTTPAREFMNATEEIDVLSVSTDYYNKVTNFYSWFFQRLEEIHKADRDYVHEQERLARRTYGKHLGESLLSVAEQVVTGQMYPDAILTHIPFESVEIGEIINAHADPGERFDAFIKFAEENYGSVDDAYKKKIRDIYIAGATSHNYRL